MQNGNELNSILLSGRIASIENVINETTKKSQVIIVLDNKRFKFDKQKDKVRNFVTPFKVVASDSPDGQLIDNLDVGTYVQVVGILRFFAPSQSYYVLALHLEYRKNKNNDYVEDDEEINDVDVCGEVSHLNSLLLDGHVSNINYEENKDGTVISALLTNKRTIINRDNGKIKDLVTSITITAENELADKMKNLLEKDMLVRAIGSLELNEFDSYNFKVSNIEYIKKKKGTFRSLEEETFSDCYPEE